MASIWTDTVEMPHFQTLDKDIRTNVLIIGGGMTGILCAYYLKQAGVDYCLLESETICSGITAHTTAKITSQQGLIYERLLQKEGFETAKLYRTANEQAVKRYRDFGWYVDCEMEEKALYVYERENREKLERELEALGKLGASVEFLEQTKLPFDTAGAIRIDKQLQFHPLKFAAALAKDLCIYEHSAVREMTEYFALTNQGSVAAEKIIVATHFPFINKRGSYYMKLHQERARVVALENAMQADGMYVDGEYGGLSFRNYKDLLLVGGGSHRTGKKQEQEMVVEQSAAEYFKNAKTVASWATQDCMSLDGLPYIGRYSATTPDLYVASGYHKWGMTGAMLAAMVLSDLVTEKENEFAAIFSPSRSILKPQLAVNLLEAVKGILRPKKGHRCSHMGCVLQWNEKEQTWDCPCHGSRFKETGELIENPARHDIKA